MNDIKDILLKMVDSINRAAEEIDDDSACTALFRVALCMETVIAFDWPDSDPDMQQENEK